MPYNFGHVCAIVGILPTSVGFFQNTHSPPGTEFQVFGNNDRKEAWDSPTALAVARAKTKTTRENLLVATHIGQLSTHPFYYNFNGLAQIFLNLSLFVHLSCPFYF